MNDNPVMLDLSNNELIGQEEIVLNSLNDILRLSQIIETKRTTASHNMNHSSSRTHAVCELKMYRIVDGLLYTNSLKFMDLAGSERW